MTLQEAELIIEALIFAAESPFPRRIWAKLSGWIGWR